MTAAAVTAIHPVNAAAQADAREAIDTARAGGPNLAEAIATYTALDARLARARLKMLELEKEHTAAAAHVVRTAAGRSVLICGGSVVYVGTFNNRPLVRVVSAEVVR